MSEAKYFIGKLKINCGEYEFEYPKAVEAENYEEAEEKMRDYARTFYDGDSTEDYKDCFFFNGGEIAVTFGLFGAVTKEEWLNHNWNRFHI